MGDRGRDLFSERSFGREGEKDLDLRR